MADPTRRIVVDGVDFSSLVQFPRILRAATAAMQPPRLVIALLMVVALVALGAAWDAAAEPGINPGGLLAGEWTAADAAAAERSRRAVLQRLGIEAPPREETLSARGALALIASAEGARHERGSAAADAWREARREIAALRPLGAFEATSALVTDAFRRGLRGIIELRPADSATAACDVLVRLPRAVWRQERGFTVVFALILLVLMAVGGGALSRMAACDFAGRERLRVTEAMDFALSRWLRLLLTPVLPLLIAAGVAAVILLLGLLLLPWLDLVGGLLYGAALLLALALAILVVGYAAGFSLLVPAVACENCDAADAQQRAYAYLLSRPLHLLGYGLTALAGLVLGYVVVALVASLALDLAASLTRLSSGSAAVAEAGGFGIWFVAGDAGAPQAMPTWHEGWAAAGVRFWQRAMIDLVAAYVVSYWFTATTIVYLLMRHVCDGQDVEEIWAGNPRRMSGDADSRPGVSQ